MEVSENSNKFPLEIFNGYDLRHHIEIKKFKKNEQIPDSYFRPELVSIVKSGIVVLFWKSDKREKIIVDFISDLQLLKGLLPFNFRKVGKLCGQCLQETIIIFIPRDFIYNCLANSNAISEFYNAFHQERNRLIYTQLKSLKTADLEERYLFFLKEYKHIYNHISDRMIANYLGVHHTSLSRIKGKLAGHLNEIES